MRRSGNYNYDYAHSFFGEDFKSKPLYRLILTGGFGLNCRMYFFYEYCKMVGQVYPKKFSSRVYPKKIQKDWMQIYYR